MALNDSHHVSLLPNHYPKFREKIEYCCLLLESEVSGHTKVNI